MFRSKATLLLVACALVTWAVCGCESESSTTPRLDLAPPAVPTNLSSTLSDGIVKVTWDPNLVDGDFVGFQLNRAAHGVEIELLATPTNVTQYFDQNPISGYCTYKVTAVDRNGNQSAYATTTVYVGQLNPYQPYQD